MRRLLPSLLTTLLIGPVLATPAAAGSPSATLTWEAESAKSAERSLLLVLETGPEGWSLLDARTAPVAAKARRGQTADSGPLFALLDRDGRPLAAGRLRVPAKLHGPVLDEAGEVRCVGVPLASAVLPLRLPMPESASELRLFEVAEFSPTAGEPLAAALQGRPEDAGLRLLASFGLGGVAGGER